MTRDRHPIEKLNAHQIAALMEWRATQGRQWRRALRECWESGRYGALPADDVALLQQVRNAIGPSGLSRIKFD